MLSRVADALYWMSRYVERAEDITRILTVNFHSLLDAPVETAESAWQPIIAITGDEERYRQCYQEYNARNVCEFLLWNPDNPNAVTTCITLARENARSVREQISSEMWENLNRLYFLVRDLDREETGRSGPYEFFDQIRYGSWAFQGITAETMTHGDGYEFIQLGKMMERGDKTIRTLDVKYAAVNQLAEGPEASLQLIVLLRSCSAFEAFRKTGAAMLQPGRVAQFLLLDQEFPRAVGFCLSRALRSINAISGNVGGEQIRQSHQLNNPQRQIGRICADLEYLNIEEILDHRMHPFLDGLLLRINLVGDEITRTFFNTQVILPGRTQQPAQQQQ
ncbi:MAG: alpha-E domain-containing protein [Blastocatellia bacterium]